MDNKFKIGDKVEVVGYNDYSDKNGLKRGDTFIIRDFDSGKRYIRKTIGGWGVHKNSCKLVKKLKEQEYKIIKPFTLKEIFAANPCNSNGEIWDLCQEFRSAGLDYNMKIKTYKTFKMFKTTMKYMSWFERNGFIKEIKKETNLEKGMKLTNDNGEILVICIYNCNLIPFHVKSDGGYLGMCYGGSHKTLSELNKGNPFGEFRVLNRNESY